MRPFSKLVSTGKPHRDVYRESSIDQYRFLGALTNDNRKLANFAGFYKGIQSAGGAVSFRVNTMNISSVSELATCWALLAGSIVIAAFAIIKKVKDYKGSGEEKSR